MKYSAYHYGYKLHLSGCHSATMIRQGDKFYCDRCKEPAPPIDWIEVKIHD